MITAIAAEFKAVSPRERAWKAMERARAPWIRLGIAEVRRLFEQERKAAVILLDAFMPNAADWRELLIDLHQRTAEAFARRMANRLSATLRKKDAAEELSGVWFPAVREYAETRMGDLVTGIIEATRGRIRDVLTAGIAAGEGVYELSRRIDKLYLEDLIPHRSEVIARTEVIAASNSGGRAAAVAVAGATNLKLEHEWLATGDMRTREAHRNASGQRQPIDKPYTVMGEKLMFPGDTSLGASGANVIQCRCSETFATV